MDFASIFLVISGTLVGLTSGILFDFSITIVPSLRALTAKQHIEAMQVINVKIVNLFFLVCFMGPVIFLPFTTYLHREAEQFPMLIIASALYIVGVIGVTVVGNIPLNNQLETVNLNQLSEEEAEPIRQDYQGVNARWMKWHTVRTVVSIMTTILILVICLSR